MRVKILSKENCSLCSDSYELCKSMGIQYSVEYPQTKQKQYPQIYVDDKLIGNYFDFVDYLDDLEDILVPNSSRFTIFPIKYPKLWELYKKAQMSNWTAEEIDFSDDLRDLDKINDNEKHFIEHIIAFFAGSDGIVFENINTNFADEVQIPEARSFYAFQAHNEMVHGETYSLLIDTYVKDSSRKNELFDAINTIECIKNKADWAIKNFDRTKPFAERLIAFACVEGIYFSGAFCAIFWLKKRGLFPGLCFSNELISRDEGMHLEFAVELYNTLKNKPSSEKIRNIITEAVDIEKKFIIESLPCKLIGMNSELMSTYIEFVADRFCKQIGIPVIWNSKNPFDFMENISLEGKTNFFEKRVGEYGKLDDAGENLTFDNDEDF